MSGSFAEGRRELQPLLLVSEHRGLPWPEQLERHCSEPRLPEAPLAVRAASLRVRAARRPAGSCVSAGPEPAGRGGGCAENAAGWWAPVTRGRLLCVCRGFLYVPQHGCAGHVGSGFRYAEQSAAITHSVTFSVWF